MLEDQNFWPAKGLKLKYRKPKYFNYQITIDYKIYIKTINIIYIKLLDNIIVSQYISKFGNTKLIP